MARKPLFLLVVVTSLLLVAAPAYTEEGSLLGKTICLDAGHGGSDPGAVNAAYTLEEADINLDVAYGLKSLLEGDGAVVVMPRIDDSYLDNRDRYTFCDAEAADILVSVHTNSVDDPDWDGSMTLYFHDDDKVLARAIHDVMYLALKGSAPDPNVFNDFGLKKFASGVLLKSDMPAAMMEPLFMSNPGEAQRLVTPIYLDYGVTANPDCIDCRRAQIARAIYDGVLSYFEPGAVNAPPIAGFSFTTDGHTVTFADTSTDSDGTVSSWSWSFGDGVGTSTAQNPTYTYGADGTYMVSLTVTDNEGATDTVTHGVTVIGGGGGGITLTATGYKDRGLQRADLAWSGATSPNVDVYRDGSLLMATANDGFYTDNIDRRGGGSYTYKVCEAGDPTTCSNEATVTY